MENGFKNKETTTKKYKNLTEAFMQFILEDYYVAHNFSTQRYKSFKMALT